MHDTMKIGPVLPIKWLGTFGPHTDAQERRSTEGHNAGEKSSLLGNLEVSETNSAGKAFGKSLMSEFFS